jgi:hypothetical protein
VEEDTLSNHQVYNNNINKQDHQYGQFHPDKVKKNSANIGMEEGSPLSPITGRVAENLSNTI